MNFDTVLFRSSSIGELLTEPRSKSELLSETMKGKLLDVYGEVVHGRREDVSSKQMEKGNVCEKAAIDMWRRHKNIVVFQNTERFNNEYITGKPDLLIKQGNLVVNIPDIKNAWSWNTYAEQVMKPISKKYYFQGQSYMWLVGAPMATFVYCLVNATPELINDEKYRLARRLGLIDPSGNETYHEKASQIERNMIFDMKKFIDDNGYYNFDSEVSAWNYDIPVSKRIHEKVVMRNDEDIELIKSKVPLWRQHLRTIDSIFATTIK